MLLVTASSVKGIVVVFGITHAYFVWWPIWVGQGINKRTPLVCINTIIFVQVLVVNYCYVRTDMKNMVDHYLRAKPNLTIIFDRLIVLHRLTLICARR